MKMIPGSGTSLDYALFISNCQARQRNYKIPITSLADVQLYIDFGDEVGADTAAIDLVYTCGAVGTIEFLTPVAYVVGQDPDGNWYAVFNGFNETTAAQCFVIAITIGSTIWFSEEYCFAGTCEDGMTLVKSCYGNLDPLISFDREGIYFGQSQGGTIGDATVVYEHKFFMRSVEVALNGIKNDFKQGRTRTFRTESVDLYLFTGEFVPEWYLKHVDAVFKRGEVFIGTETPKKYLLSETSYENADDCTRCWKPNVLLQEKQFQSFSCEEDPCTVVIGGEDGGAETCCNPTVNEATVEFGEGNTVCVDFNTCDPAPANGYTIQYRLNGSLGGYTTADTGITTSPFCFPVGGVEGDQYEGFIFSDCGGGITGSLVPWTTGEPVTESVAQTVCSGIFSQFEITGAPGDLVTVRAVYSGFMTKNLTGSFVKARLQLNTPDGVLLTQDTASGCYPDTLGHGFSLVLEDVITIDGTGVSIVTTNAVVDNPIGTGSNSLSLGVVDVNGVVVNIWQPGCHGNSATGGPC